MAEKYRLFFARSREQVAGHAEPRRVYVWPGKDRWDDYGHKLAADCLICGPDGQLWEPSTNLALIASGVKDSREAIGSFLGVEGIAEFGRSRESAQNWFGTLQNELGEYRQLVAKLGAAEARAALEAMHDVAAERLKRTPEPWLYLLLQSDAFNISMLRSTTRYFAFRRARDILLGEEKTSIRMTRAAGRLTFKLDSFSADHVIDLDFGESRVFDRRINVLIGENGVGKSQALSRLVSALERPRRGTGTFEPRGEFSRVIAFSGIPQQKSLPTSLRRQKNLQYKFFSLSPEARPRSSLKTIPLTATLADLTRDEVEIGGLRRIDHFSGAVDSWLPFGAIGLPMKSGVQTRTPLIQVDASGYLTLDRLHASDSASFLQDHAAVDLTKPLTFFAPGSTKIAPLSSGQELFFRFALQLCASIEIGTLVIIDEPENHLHPNFITRMLILLRNILRRTGSFALIASHSPFVVREVTRKDVAIISRTDNGAPLVRRPRLQTLGASVEAVSSYVFGDETLPALARLTSEALESIADENQEGAIRLLQEDLSNEAISHVLAMLYSRDSAGG